MPRRRQHEEHENHERWLVSYADFITLLFAFFVVMYSISSVNEGKYKVFTESLEGIFTQPDRSVRPIPIGENVPRATDRSTGMQPENESFKQITKGMEAAFSELIEEGQITLRGTETWLEIELNSSLLFPSGNATPNDAAFELIERLAGILAPYRNPIQVQGFTDNLPISTPAYPTNWELSSARAASVVRMLTTHGVDPARLAAVGYGEHQPVADNATAEGRARNRRVVLAIARELEIRRPTGGFGRQAAEATGTQPAISSNTPSAGSGAVNSPTP